MKLHVTWSQIEAECGDYREGFVAIYRKYEGMPTDEKDAQGRAVKVTMASFARHMKIPERTFMDWVSKTAAAAAQPRQRDRTREAIDRMPAEDKAKLASDLMADPDVRERVESIEPEPQPEPAPVARREHRPSPEPEPPTPWDLFEAITGASRYVTEAVRLATALGQLNEDGREIVDGYIGRIRAGCDHLASLVEGGGMSDAAIETWIGEQS
jgi:hypothetical protein